MGASISIHPEVIETTEFSFVNKKSGQIFSEGDINKIIENACKDYDYKPSFYDSYKVDKNGKNSYAELAKGISEGSNK
jgi:hypothetical protein